MSINAGNGNVSPGFREVTKDPQKLPELVTREMILDALMAVAQRLDGVQIENRPSSEIIQRFSNGESLIYFDPPYVSNTRAQAERYLLEWADTQHAEAAALLRQCAGYVVVSGYACPLYAELYEAHGWERRDKEAQTNSGGSRIESIWLSPRTSQALQAGAGLPLFTLLQS